MEAKLVRKTESQISAKSFYPNDHLFCDEDGSPIKFHVLPSPDHDYIVELITVGGGLVIDGDKIGSPGVITITSSSQNIENIKDVISSSYIYVCCYCGELVDKEDFRFVIDDSVSDASKSKTRLTTDEDLPNTRLSKEEIHEVLLFILKCEPLWKEIKEKISGIKSWRTIQRSFAFWALERYYKISSSNMESLCCTLLSDHEKQSSHHSEVMSTHISRLQSEVPVNHRSGDEHEEEDLSTCGKKKPVAGRMSAVIDDESDSEPESLQIENHPHKETMQSGEGSNESVGKCVDHNMIVSVEEEVVAEMRVEEESSIQKLKVKNKDVEVENSQQKSPVALRRKRKLMRINHSVPFNQWLSKGDSNQWNKVGKMIISTPLKSADDSKSDKSTVTKGQIVKSACGSSQLVTKAKNKFHTRLYSYEEDMKLLHWICCKRKKSNDSLNGNRIWKFLESRHVLPDCWWCHKDFMG